MAERKRAERVVERLHLKLGLNKYHRTFAIVERYRPDLLTLKGYIEGLPQEEDERDSLERANWVRNKLSKIPPNIFEFIRERDTSTSAKEKKLANKESQKEQFRR